MISQIGEGMMEWLEKDILGEVGDKALGPVGFPLAFCKHSWRIVTGELMETIAEFQETGEFEKSHNASFIIIVPKK